MLAAVSRDDSGAQKSVDTPCELAPRPHRASRRAGGAVAGSRRRRQGKDGALFASLTQVGAPRGRCSASLPGDSSCMLLRVPSRRCASLSLPTERQRSVDEAIAAQVIARQIASRRRAFKPCPGAKPLISVDAWSVGESALPCLGSLNSVDGMGWACVTGVLLPGKESEQAAPGLLIRLPAAALRRG